jgi:hypothetical protein
MVGRRARWRFALLILYGLNLLVKAIGDVDVDQDTCALDFGEISDDIDETPPEPPPRAENEAERRQRHETPVQTTHKGSSSPSEQHLADLDHKYSELVRNFERQNYELEWTRMDLNETNRFVFQEF